MPSLILILEEIKLGLPLKIIFENVQFRTELYIRQAWMLVDMAGYNFSSHPACSETERQINRLISPTRFGGF